LLPLQTNWSSRTDFLDANECFPHNHLIGGLARAKAGIAICGEWMPSTAQLPIWAQILLREPNSRQSDDSEFSAKLRECLVLLAHGSKDPRWREPFERLFLRSRRDYDAVKLAFMEFTEPTLLEAADECVRDGFHSLRILPLFMASGAHLATDVPKLFAEVKERHPQLQLELMSPIGEDPRVIALMTHIVREYLERL
jgi:sirohydrochlorin cobaltochelatase